MKPILYKGIIYQTIILILFWASSTQAALALADVKAQATVSKSTITLGDLLENLDAGHDIWVMNAPAPGKKAYVSTKYLASLTRQHNVYWQNSRNVRQITVNRTGKSLKAEDLKHLIKQEMASHRSSGQKYGITLDQKNAVIHLPDDGDIKDITLEEFSFTQRTGKFSAVVSIPVGDGSFKMSTLSGRTHAISYVPALNKTIPPGREITARDLEWTPLPTLGIGRNIVRTKDQLIGMTPRRGLRPNIPLKVSDLTRPNIIGRGDMVSILFNAGKINLTAIGKAIEKGGRGDVIRVMNSKSHKTIEAVVIGPGQVQVISGHNRIAQLNN